jgi:hypothetical protein
VVIFRVYMSYILGVWITRQIVLSGVFLDNGWYVNCDDDVLR